MYNTPLTTASQLDDVETWENVTAARHSLKRFSSKGDLMDELVGSNKTFHITTRERHLNQERAANDELDPFMNGMFAPVRLLDSTEDAAEIAANPNLMGESEMLDLVKGNVKSLEKRIKDVRNPVVIERLLNVAETNDSTIGRIQVIKSRLSELSPSLYTEIEAGTPH